MWNPEAFFNTMTVNGNTWPVLEVAPERYRFRLAQRLGLAVPEPVAVPGQRTGQEACGELPFYQIGTEQGLLPQVVRIETGFATPFRVTAGRDWKIRPA